jgi:pimeloyl-ACP methyl ester carboxylesterase
LSSTAQTATEIRPFNVSVSDHELADLRRRIEATRWPDKETDASQGVQLDTIQALAAYWPTVPVTSTSSSTITAGGLASRRRAALRDLEARMSERPVITVPTVTIGSDFDGAAADGGAYAKKFSGPHSHRILEGIGHNVPQEVSGAFTDAILEVGGGLR